MAVKEYLLEKFPKCEGDLGRLRVAIERHKREHPEYQRHISAFEWYFGLTDEGLRSNSEVASRLGVSASRANELRQHTAKRLWARRNPQYWN